MQVWHITIATVDRMPLFRDEAARRKAVTRLARLRSCRVVLFHLGDDHVHVVVIACGASADRIATGLKHVLRSLSCAPLAPADIRPVASRRHAERLVPYLLQQTTHHGLDAHPALWSGSCFADLVGARRVEGLELALPEVLPRFRAEQAYRAAGLQGAPAPANDARLRALGATGIAAAAAAAVCADPGLRGNGATVGRARRLAVRLSCATGIHHDEIAWALGVTPRAARRLGARAVEPTLVHATRLRIAIDDAVATAARMVG